MFWIIIFISYVFATGNITIFLCESVGFSLEKEADKNDISKSYLLIAIFLTAWIALPYILIKECLQE